MIGRHAVVLLALSAATGCAQLFGLDETQSASGDDDPIDAAPDDGIAPIDADLTPDAMPSACDPVTQTGCDADQACDVDLNSQSAYCRLGGSVGALQPCVNLEDCVAGTTCQGGACRSFCADSATCPTPENDCHLTFFVASVCDTVCDVRSTDDGGCGMNLICQLAQSPDQTGFGSYCSPNPAGTLAVGADCTAEPAGCVPGSVCLNPGSAQTCFQLCYVGDGTCSGCTELNDGTGALTIHGNPLGACL